MSTLTWVAYATVLIPFVAYVIAFSYETILSFLRLSPHYQRRHEDQGYVHGTWEITHTLLVFSFTSFFVLFSDVIVELADRAYVPIFLVGIAFAVRGILYLCLFYVAEEDKPRPFWDAIFALTHLCLLVSVAWAAAIIVKLLIDIPTLPTAALVPIVSPPLILVLAVCALPLIRLYARQQKPGNS